ncbi:MAG: trypsin-like peptidase domain-containing protein [Bacteroidales bacterium]|nr:trypsin-like peptidase domain-containing protein [Bacteroidales bacterium]
MKKFLVSSIAIVFAALSCNVYAQDFTAAAEKSIHSVVYIQCIHHKITTYYEDFFSNDFWGSFFGGNPFSMFSNPEPQKKVYTYPTAGSGVIVSKDGYIVTNNHVVADADSVTVTLNDRRQYNAVIVGTDAFNDLAVIRIEADNLVPITYGNSDEVKVGHWVLAVGNPFNLTSTVTAGIVSAKARNINILSSNSSAENLTSFIQTDAAMNPGNSGGALVNMQGELIGINAAIASNTGSYAGYSFAIPVNIAHKVVNDIIRYGYTQRASAGFETCEIDSKLKNEKHIQGNEGLYVMSVVENGAAYKAGIKEGDIVKTINAKKVNTNSELSEILTQMSPEETITAEIERNNSLQSKQIKLLDQKTTEQLEETQASKGTVSAQGARIRPLSQKEQNQYNIQGGLLVVKVEGGAFKNQRIKEGLIIIGIDNKSNLDMNDAVALSKKKGRTLIQGFYPQTQSMVAFVINL